MVIVVMVVTVAVRAVVVVVVVAAVLAVKRLVISSNTNTPYQYVQKRTIMRFLRPCLEPVGLLTHSINTLNHIHDSQHPP